MPRLGPARAMRETLPAACHWIGRPRPSNDAIMGDITMGSMMYTSSPTKVTPLTGRQIAVNSRMMVLRPMTIRPRNSRRTKLPAALGCVPASPPMGRRAWPIWRLSPISQSGEDALYGPTRTSFPSRTFSHGNDRRGVDHAVPLDKERWVPADATRSCRNGRCRIGGSREDGRELGRIARHVDVLSGAKIGPAGMITRAVGSGAIPTSPEKDRVQLGFAPVGRQCRWNSMTISYRGKRP